MNWTPELRTRLNQYLSDIRQALADRPADVQRDICADLESQITDALASRGPSGAPPSLADLEAVLARMDPPSAFAPTPAETVAARPRGPRGWLWFALAVAFLAVNVAGWYGATHRPALAAVLSAATESGDTIATESEPLVWAFSDDLRPDDAPATLTPAIAGTFEWASPRKLVFTPDRVWPAGLEVKAQLSATLRTADGRPMEPYAPLTVQTPEPELQAVSVQGLSSDRLATLRLAFNGTPDADSIRAHLDLQDTAGEKVIFTVVSPGREPVLRVNTGSIRTDQLVVNLKAGWRLAGAPVPASKDSSQKLSLTAMPALVSMRAEAPSFGWPSLKLDFGQPMEAEGAADFIRIEPAVRVTVSRWSPWYGEGLELDGEFQPGHMYTLTLKEGLAAQSGQRTAKAITRTVQFPNRDPSFVFSAEGRYFSPLGPMRLPITAVNIHRLKVTARTLPAANLAFFALRDADLLNDSYTSRDDERAGRLTAPLVSREYTLPDRPNVEQALHADLAELLGRETRGACLIEASADTPNYPKKDARLVVVSDLGLTVKRERASVSAWVTSLRDASSVEGAEVTVVSQNNQTLAQGRSDAAGWIRMDLPAATDDELAQPLVAVVAHGNDSNFLVLPGSEVEYPDARGAPYTPPGAMEAMVYTERGIYRPGETVHAQLLVRNADGAAPAPFPAMLRVIRPDGQTFRDLPLLPNDRGAVAASFAIPDYLPTGSYILQAALPDKTTVLGETTVKVEDFVPPQVVAEWRDVPARIAAGEDLKGILSARYLFGRAAANLAVQYSVVFEAAPFITDRWPGYAFGDAEKKFEAISRDLPRNRLSAEGSDVISAPTSKAWRPPAAIRARLFGTVIEPGGRPVYAIADALVDAYPFYVGLKAEGGRATAPVGSPLRVDIATVLPDGAAVRDVTALKAVWSRVQWSHALRRGESGVYQWKSERTLTAVQETLVNLKDGTGSLSFSAPSGGEYVLTVSDPASESSGSLSIWATSPESRWADATREQPDRVEIRADREACAPGETVALTLQAPFSGPALLTVERDEVLERRIIQIENRTATVSLTANEHWTPNVWCTVSVIRPVAAEEVWSAHRAFGAIPISVRPAGRKLAVEIASADTVRPRGPLPATVTVRDESGAPVANAEVTVAAVDEAILMLTQYPLPDPWKYFLRLRLPGVIHMDLFSRLLPVLNDAAAGTALQAGAGGAADALRARRLNPVRGQRFVPVALWKEGLLSDAEGRIAVSFDLPEFTGQLRLTAVAFDARRAGAVQRAVTVKRPLVVQPSLPRFLAPGDECDSIVSVFNETGAEANIQVSMAAEGPVRVAVTNASFRLASGVSTQWVARVRADLSAGLAHIVFRAAAGDERYEETVELPVRPVHGPVVRNMTGEIKAGGSLNLSAPAEALPGTAYVEVRAGAGPAVQFGNALAYLLRYPYGCLEQTSSGVLPLIHLAPLLAASGPTDVAQGDPAALIRAGVLRIASMQQNDGSFAMWPQSTMRADWTSVYATHVLAEARHAGFEVPAETMTAALDHLRARLDKAPPLEAGDATLSRAWLDDGELRAYACHILALAGKPAEGWNARLAELAPRLSYPARLHAALALNHAGKPREALALLRAAGLPAPRPRTLDTLYGSAARDLALALTAWLDIEPAAPETADAARRLIEQGPKGEWGTTQDNAWALFALGLRAARLPAKPEPFTATFTAPGEKAVRPVTHEKSLYWRLPAGTSWSEPVSLVNQGTGAMPYSIMMEYVPAQPPAPDANAAPQMIVVERTLLNEKGEELPASAAHQQGDRVVVRLHLDPRDRAMDQVVITELLPAGLELENPNIAAAQELSWIPKNAGAGHRTEMRDDRLLVFSTSFKEPFDLYYTARAVTPGRYVWPGARAEAMYDPALSGASAEGACEVRP